MSAVDGPTKTTVVQFANMDQALAAGDLEAVMVMLGIERASTAEEVVKTKIETIRANNARIQELNEILQKIQGKDDKEGTRLGITVDEDALSLETIRKTCLEGPGHFLGADQTLRLMQTEYVYPAVGDRMSPKEWAEQGKPSYIDRAAKQTRAILSRHYPRHVPDSVDEAVRARFPVRLPKEQMRPTA